MAITIFQIEARNMVGGHFTLDLAVGSSIIDAAEEKNDKDEWVLNFYVVVDTKADWERRRFCAAPWRANLDHLGADAALFHIISYASRTGDRIHVFEETHVADTGGPMRVHSPIRPKRVPAARQVRRRDAERRMASYAPGEVCVSCGKDVGHGLRYCPPPCNTDLRNAKNRVKDYYNLVVEKGAEHDQAEASAGADNGRGDEETLPDRDSAVGESGVEAPGEAEAELDVTKARDKSGLLGRLRL